MILPLLCWRQFLDLRYMKEEPNRILWPHWNEELLTEVWDYWGSSISRAEWRKLCRKVSSRKHSRHFLQSFLNKSFTYIKVKVYKAREVHQRVVSSVFSDLTMLTSQSRKLSLMTWNLEEPPSRSDLIRVKYLCSGSYSKPFLEML